MKKSSRFLKAVGVAAVAGLALTACSGDNSPGDGGGGDGGPEKDVVIGYVPWDEVVAATYLWENLLTERGYNVELMQLEPAAVYAGLAQNDTDLYMASLEETHADYWDEYGDNFDTVVEWYEPLRQGIVVPDYMDDYNSIEDLEGNADEFNGEIIGIEAGAGIMQEMEAATKAYDLSDYDVIDGSTAAMLSTFETAVENNEPVAATGWNPHWAVGEFGMKFLDDPEGVFTDGDVYKVIASEDAQEKDELMEDLSGFEMDDDHFYSLLAEIRDAGANNEEDAVESWLEKDDNQDYVDAWFED